MYIYNWMVDYEELVVFIELVFLTLTLASVYHYMPLHLFPDSSFDATIECVRAFRIYEYPAKLRHK